MSNVHELASVAKDAFVVLIGAIEIKYRDGDVWRPEEGQPEHPVVHRLRAASLVSLTSDPPDPPPPHLDDETAQRLRDERKVNERFRDFVLRLESLCHDAGMPRAMASGDEVLAWIRGRIR